MLCGLHSFGDKGLQFEPDPEQAVPFTLRAHYTQTTPASWSSRYVFLRLRQGHGLGLHREIPGNVFVHKLPYSRSLSRPPAW